MKKVVEIFTLIMLSLLILPALTACRPGKSEAPPPEFVVKRGDIAVTVPADGNLSFIRDRKLTFGTGGTIAEIKAKEGEWVREGQVLARLDSAAFELAVSTAEIALKAAALDVEIATNAFKKITYPYSYYTFALGVPESLAAIGDALNRLATAKSIVSLEMSPEQYAEVMSKLKEATERLVIAREKLGRGEGPDLFLSGQLPLTTFWTLRDTQLNMDKANLALDIAANDLRRAQDELPKAVLTAPFAGIVAQVNFKEGDKISSVDYQSRVVLEILDPDQLELKATVDEIDIARVAVGQEANITLDALPGVMPVGEVTFISPLSRTEGGVIVYDVKISVDAAKFSGMMSGMTVRADIVTDRRNGVITVPERAIYKTGEGNSAVKVKSGDRLEERVIKTGLSDRTQTEVTEGLREGEVVVIGRKTVGFYGGSIPGW